MDGNDKTFHLAYDERWRVVAVFRESHASPKEEFFHHPRKCAGLDGCGGGGGSSYIDTVILRNKDANTNWVTAAADGTMERRDYYCHNWRGDVVALVTSGGAIHEWIKYSAYGIPCLLVPGDVDGDFDVDSTDTNQIQTWINGPTYKVIADLDLDGDVDAGEVLSRRMARTNTNPELTRNACQNSL